MSKDSIDLSELLTRALHLSVNAHCNEVEQAKFDLAMSYPSTELEEVIEAALEALDECLSETTAAVLNAALGLPVEHE